MKMIPLQRLTPEVFAPYGDVIEATGEPSYQINNGNADRYHALATVTHDAQGSAIISIVNSRKQPTPHTVTVVERHPLGSQAFIPRDKTPFVIVVAEAGERVRSDQLRAFISNGEQGINYHAGTWHGLLLTPFADMSFICVDRDGAGNNCEEWHFDEVDQVLLDIPPLD